MAPSANLESLVVSLFEINALKFGDFKMKVGINSPVYFDLRVIVSHPKLLEILAELVHNKINESDVQFKHICGVPYTALPIATLVSVKRNTSMLIRRKESKNYGLRKMIEGQFSIGDKCVIIEDVVTSGSSILDTVNDLKKSGLEVTDAFLVLNREQGGIKNLEEKGIKAHVLTTLSEVLQILVKNGKIQQSTVHDVQQYITKSQIKSDGTFRTHEEQVNGSSTKSRLQLSLSARAELATNALSKQILNLMNSKQSLLCVAVDVGTSNELLNIAEAVGPYVAVLKTHFDIIKDMSEAVLQKLKDIAKDKNFFILEDRKFSDIGSVVKSQYSLIHPWSDLVTVHSLPGPGILEGLKQAAQGQQRGCFLVTEMSSTGNLIDDQYTKATLEMVSEYENSFVVGVVCQSPLEPSKPGLIQLTPGVSLDDKTDGLGQVYTSPENAVLIKGADLAVVGRGIIKSRYPEKMAQIYKNELWEAYLKRIN